MVTFLFAQTRAVQTPSGNPIIGILPILVLIVVIWLVVRLLTRGKTQRENLTKRQIFIQEKGVGEEDKQRNVFYKAREQLSKGCPNCGASTGITKGTTIEKIKTVATGKCFYCGYDFINLLETSDDEMTEVDE